MSAERFLIVDDFYRKPEAMREFALRCPYFTKGTLSQNVAGVESVYSFYNDAIIDKFEKILGQSIIVLPEINAFGRIRIMMKNDVRRTQVHTDDTEWTAVVYLSQNHHARGGTCFYRHKPTGLDHYPNESILARMGLTQEEFDRDIVLRDSLDMSKWEVVDFCAMKFNRCVLLRGRQFFHGSDRFFGDCFENARMTQNFFFDTNKEAA